MGIITSDIDVATNRLSRPPRTTSDHLELAVDSSCGVLAAWDRHAQVRCRDRQPGLRLDPAPPKPITGGDPRWPQLLREMA